MKPTVLLALALTVLAPQAEAVCAEPSSLEMIAYCERMLAADANMSAKVRVRHAQMTTLVRSSEDAGHSQGEVGVELIAADKDGWDWLIICQFDRHYPLVAKAFWNTPDFCDCVADIADPSQLEALNRLAATPTP